MLTLTHSCLQAMGMTRRLRINLKISTWCLTKFYHSLLSLTMHAFRIIWIPRAITQLTSANYSVYNCSVYNQPSLTIKEMRNPVTVVEFLGFLKLFWACGSIISGTLSRWQNGLSVCWSGYRLDCLPACLSSAQEAWEVWNGNGQESTLRYYSSAHMVLLLTPIVPLYGMFYCLAEWQITRSLGMERWNQHGLRLLQCIPRSGEKNLEHSIQVRRIHDSFSVLLFKAVHPQAAGGGTPEVIAYLNGVMVHGALGLKNLIVKFASLVFSVSAGLAVGTQGPLIAYGWVTKKNQIMKICF